MARIIGRALAGERGAPPMEIALVGLLFAMVLVGGITDLDQHVRIALTGFLGDLYGMGAALRI